MIYIRPASHFMMAVETSISLQVSQRLLQESKIRPFYSKQELV
jgi:hypothetical protein